MLFRSAQKFADQLAHGIVDEKQLAEIREQLEENEDLGPLLEKKLRRMGAKSEKKGKDVLSGGMIGRKDRLSDAESELKQKMAQLAEAQTQLAKFGETKEFEKEELNLALKTIPELESSLAGLNETIEYLSKKGKQEANVDAWFSGNAAMRRAVQKRREQEERHKAGISIRDGVVNSAAEVKTTKGDVVATDPADVLVATKNPVSVVEAKPGRGAVSATGSEMIESLLREMKAIRSLLEKPTGANINLHLDGRKISESQVRISREA